jgi:hypothetical protein
MFRAAHRDLAIELYDRSKDGVGVNTHDAKPQKRDGEDR